MESSNRRRRKKENAEELRLEHWDTYHRSLLRRERGSSNPGHTSLDRNCFSKHVAACFCQPMHGWQGSPSSEIPSGGPPSARSAHDGTWKPAASNASAHFNNGWMEEQFSCFARELTIVSATPGWRCLIIFKASAQLPKLAAGLDLTALRRPKPPSHRGSGAWTRASHERDNPMILEKHRQTPSSCALANSSELSGPTHLKKKFARAAAQ